MKFYFDTSIWLDLYFMRNSRGKIAKKLIEKIINEEGIILYSDFTIKEFKRVLPFESEINQILSIAKPNNIKRIHSTKDQVTEALKISKNRKVPFGDAIHAILARIMKHILFQ